jgi:methyl-accepting chemotaxis protein
MAAFLSVAALLVVLGGVDLYRSADLHARMDAVAVRDLQPLVHLRKVNDDYQTYTVHGLAGAMSSQVDVRNLQIELQAAAKGRMAQDLQALLRATPADLRGDAQLIETNWVTFAEADRRYQANLTSPDAKVLGDAATAAFTKVGEATAVMAEKLEADAAVQRAAVQDAYASARMFTIVFLVGGVAVAVAFGWFFARSIRRRISPVLAAADGLAQGDLSRPIPAHGEDELGRMSAALGAGIASVRQMLAGVADSAAAVAACSDQLGSTSRTTAEASGDALTHAQTVAAEAATVSDNVANVSAGTEEMGASINEISTSANEAARVAESAVAAARATNETVSKLGESSAEISNVLRVIESIASQTSLLALNATIEAARAGEAGRGFAIVATEVKDLARETAEATEEVSNRIQAIQGDTANAVAAIGEIAVVIDRISQYQTSIAAAVEEQTATAQEIGRGIAVAATSSSEIAGGASGLAAAAEASAAGADQTRLAADQLARTGEELQGLLSRFRI